MMLSAQDNIFHHLQKVTFGMLRKKKIIIPQQQLFRTKEDGHRIHAEYFKYSC